MPDVVISVQNLSKRYLLGHKRANGDGLRHAIESMIRSPANWIRSRQKDPNDQFWALRDVTFDVEQGEVVGIVGRNGAGKSTLLKLLSRITEPTTGKIRYEGRVASLLEVGTGFHPELTGRENIFLNGSILGMKRIEIQSKFDEIVEFSEIERFLDTPVKRYSSGMYVRLAFAVAAHLEPEILLIDEVLAVGDVSFQKKCLGKIGSVAREGRTVLFVSHNIAAVMSLCTRALLIDAGRLVFSGSTQATVEQYLSRSGEKIITPLAERKDRRGNGRLRFTKVSILNKRLEPVENVTSGQDLSICLEYDIFGSDQLNNAVVQIKFAGALGQPLFACRSAVSLSENLTLQTGKPLYCHISNLPLLPGVYAFTVWCTIGPTLADYVSDVGKLSVVEGNFFGTGKLPPREVGEFLVTHHWGTG
jgi:lipopolysaccharide transport system ATP-binding protein